MGWIKLHRETLEKAIWKCSTAEQKVIFITILMLANHKENQWIWKGRKFCCLPGQFITSLNTLSFYSGCTNQNIRTSLVKFEKLDFLTNETTKDGRLITIKNWDKYQSCEIEDNKQPNKEVTNNQQRGNKEVTTNKNNKKEKELKKIEYPTLNEFIEYFIINGYTKELAIRAWKGYNEANWYDSGGKKINNWKQKAQHVWFRDDNKKKVESQKKVYKSSNFDEVVKDDNITPGEMPDYIKNLAGQKTIK